MPELLKIILSILLGGSVGGLLAWRFRSKCPP
jgi:hypothetical protein